MDINCIDNVLTSFTISAKAEATSSSGSAMITFYVSPSGENRNAGTTESTPFKTIDRARQEVRKFNSNMDGDIIVYIMDGTYQLDETITFGKEDSGTNGYNILYKAVEGSKPLISGGIRVENWKQDYLNGYEVYSAKLKRDHKLRALYVNGDRALMTKRAINSTGSFGTYSFRKGEDEWAWLGGSVDRGTTFSSSDLSLNTVNQQNIELETTMTWNKVIVCVDNIVDIGNGQVVANLQMPYGAIAQQNQWSAYKPSGQQVVYNVKEWLNSPAEFYFDQEQEKIYYYPRTDEVMHNADIWAPNLQHVIKFEGASKADRVHNIVLDGLSIGYSDWNLQEVAGSYGKSTVQAATVMTAFSNKNWHNDMYRNYDILPGAIHLNYAEKIGVVNGEIFSTGAEGIVLENAIDNCEITGNYMYQVGGSGIVVGHPQHGYENDTDIHQVGGKTSRNAAPDKEKFKDGNESIPKNVILSNNYLYETGRLFEGHAPITSFYTYNLSVLHNFIYGAAYSGINIGWGWNEFDGDSNSQLPGIPTETSKNNHIKYNRVEEILQVLHDGGGIYSLGKQGNSDWSEYTEMNENYINISREPQIADGSRMVNGFHPDEGSAYIKIERNVVANIIRNVYELNNWMRKHDIIVKDGFSNTNRMEVTAPNCIVDNQYVDAEYIWNETGYNIVLNSGLQDEYKKMICDVVISDTETEFPSNVRVMEGVKISKGGMLGANDEVWFAPNGTTEFTEGSYMTKATGNSKMINVPQDIGEYKLFIIYRDGKISSESIHTLYTGLRLANVSNNTEYMVSKVNPFVLDLSTSYNFILNGDPISNSHKIDSAGEFTLEATSKFDLPQKFELKFSINVTNANRLLQSNTFVKLGELLYFDEILNNSEKNIWIAPAATEYFNESDTRMKKTSTNQASVTVPEVEGIYYLYVVDSDGKSTSSDAYIRVTECD